MAYNVLYPVSAIIAGDMSANITSAVVEVRNQDNIGIQMDWTGTPVGSFSFQVSSDFFRDVNGNIVNAGHWIALPVSPSITAAGSSDDAYVDLNQLSAMYIRVVYTAASGAGTLNTIIVAKGV